MEADGGHRDPRSAEHRAQALFMSVAHTLRREAHALTFNRRVVAADRRAEHSYQLLRPGLARKSAGNSSIAVEEYDVD